MKRQSVASAAELPNTHALDGYLNVLYQDTPPVCTFPEDT